MPQLYKDLHPWIWEYLTALAREERLPNTLLFLGPGGVGKFGLAKEFAHFILCQDFPHSPCFRCESCIRIETDSHPDLMIVSSRKSIRIEDARGIIRNAELKPWYGKFKIFIIPGVENLTNEASNALLKILEEPPDYSYFILITSSPHQVLETVLSRSWKIHFPLISQERLSEFLGREFNLSSKESRSLSALCGGYLTLAREYLKRDSQKRQRELLNLIFSHKFSKPFYFENREALRETLEFFIRFFRDVLFFKMGFQRKVFYSNFRREMEEISYFVSFEDLFDIMDRLLDILSRKDSINKRLAAILILEAARCVTL